MRPVAAGVVVFVACAAVVVVGVGGVALRGIGWVNAVWLVNFVGFVDLVWFVVQGSCLVREGWTGIVFRHRVVVAVVVQVGVGFPPLKDWSTGSPLLPLLLLLASPPALVDDVVIRVLFPGLAGVHAAAYPAFPVDPAPHQCLLFRDRTVPYHLFWTRVAYVVVRVVLLVDDL